MSGDFDNDPYDEAPVHQLDEDGDVDFDEGTGPGETHIESSQAERTPAASGDDERDAS